MSNSRIGWVVGVALLLAVVSALFAALGGKPHLEGVPCNSCHLAGQNVTPDQASKLVAAQEALCGRCHPDSVRVSHPSGFMPKVALPVEYPADWKGDLTCSTCHEVHGKVHGLLRGAKRGREMCLSCHNAAFFLGMKDGGMSIEQSGHLNTSAVLGSLELDAPSLQCLGCHSNRGDAQAVSMGRNGVMRHSSGSANHPIGKRYRDSVRSGSFHPESRLSKKILLPDGKLSCVSCHQAYKKEHGKLVMSNRGSALCFECHNI